MELEYVIVILPDTIAQVLSIIIMILLIVTLCTDVKRNKQCREIKELHKTLMQLPVQELREAMSKRRRDKDNRTDQGYTRPAAELPIPPETRS